MFSQMINGRPQSNVKSGVVNLSLNRSIGPVTASNSRGCQYVRRCINVTLLFLQDPTSALLQLAEAKNMASRFHALSLGQGQAPIATRMIKEGVREVG